MTDEELRVLHPKVNWDEPQAISLIGSEDVKLGCKYCIARDGLRGSDVPNLPSTFEAFAEHLREVHGRDVPT